MPKRSSARRSTAGPLLLIFVAIVALTGGLILAASPLKPVAWTPDPPIDAGGLFTPNHALQAIQRVPVPGTGPEDVAMLADGSMVTGTLDGWLQRAAPDEAFEPWVNVGGRPLGMDTDPAGDLVVAVAGRGLVRVTSEGDVSNVLTAIENRPLMFPDDVDIAPDGTIYFSVASWRFPFESWEDDILEGRGNGALYRMEPGGQPEALALNVYFANGVAVADDESFVLVVETSRYRVRRVWLTGPNAPGSAPWVLGLPGFPDGISAAPDGTYWLTLASPRKAIIDRTAGMPFLRHAMVALPDAMRPAPTPMAHVLHLDANGVILDSLDDATEGCFATITNAEQFGQHLLLGSLSGAAIGRYPLPGADANAALNGRPNTADAGSGAAAGEGSADEGSADAVHDGSGSGDAP